MLEGSCWQKSLKADFDGIESYINEVAPCYADEVS